MNQCDQQKSNEASFLFPSINSSSDPQDNDAPNDFLTLVHDCLDQAETMDEGSDGDDDDDDYGVENDDERTKTYKDLKISDNFDADNNKRKHFKLEEEMPSDVAVLKKIRNDQVKEDEEIQSSNSDVDSCADGENNVVPILDGVDEPCNDILLEEDHKENTSNWSGTERCDSVTNHIDVEGLEDFEEKSVNCDGDTDEHMDDSIFPNFDKPADLRTHGNKLTDSSVKSDQELGNHSENHPMTLHERPLRHPTNQPNFIRPWNAQFQSVISRTPPFPLDSYNIQQEAIHMAFMRSFFNFKYPHFVDQNATHLIQERFVGFKQNLTSQNSTDHHVNVEGTRSTATNHINDYNREALLKYAMFASAFPPSLNLDNLNKKQNDPQTEVRHWHESMSSHEKKKELGKDESIQGEDNSCEVTKIEKTSPLSPTDDELSRKPRTESFFTSTSRPSTDSDKVTSNQKQKKRSRVFIDPITEIPKLETWFSEDTHPPSYMIERYTEDLNNSSYRQRFPKLEAKNLQLWFKNHRAKVKRNFDVSKESKYVWYRGQGPPVRRPYSSDFETNVPQFCEGKSFYSKGSSSIFSGEKNKGV